MPADVSGPRQTVLKVGTAPIELSQFVQNLTIESLGKVAADGRIVPSLAKVWTVADDNRSVLIEIRAGVRFHDGSPMTTAVVADILRAKLPVSLGIAYEDIAAIAPVSDTHIRIDLRQPSQFVLEGLEERISKPGKPGSPAVGTGAFAVVDSEAVAEMRGVADYYMGAPEIERIIVTMYPSIRAAWAELLRENLDFVYEVGQDALDSLQPSTTVNVFTYTRSYQHFILLNPRVASIRSAAIRRALNAAVDRAAIVRDGLNGHGIVSSGPLWPRNWAASGLTGFPYDPAGAAQAVKAAREPIRFRCLVAPEDERIALVVQRQLAQVGVEMVLEEGTVESNSARLRSGDFDALLGGMVSGPSVLRTYLWWHSKGSRTPSKFATATIDAALDRVRHATTDDEYRAGVASFQQAVLDDPPAVFLAWGDRARALSARFQLPPETEPNIDILGSLRLWSPAARPVRLDSN
jgi:peptide/nickel transport system substrate-binding protein